MDGDKVAIYIALAGALAAIISQIIGWIRGRTESRKVQAETARIYQQMADECATKKAELIKVLDVKEQQWAERESKLSARQDELEAFVCELMDGVRKLTAQIRKLGHEPVWQPPKKFTRVEIKDEPPAVVS